MTTPDLIQAIYEHLAADSALCALLDTIEGGSPPAPMIWTGDVLPDPYPRAAPCVIVGPIIGDKNADDFSDTQSEVEVWIRLFAKSDLSSEAIDAASFALRDALHRQDVDGAHCSCSWPVSAPTSGPEIAGRRVVARLFVKG